MNILNFLKQPLVLIVLGYILAGIMLMFAGTKLYYMDFVSMKVGYTISGLGLLSGIAGCLLSVVFTIIIGYHQLKGQDS